MYNASTGIATIPVSGIYAITSQLGIDETSTSDSQYVQIAIYKNSSTRPFNAIHRPANGVAGGRVSMCQIMSLVAGDTIAIQGISNLGGGGTSTTETAAEVNHFSIHRIGGVM